MSLLLMSVWRSVLRAGSRSCTALPTRSLASSISEVTRTPSGGDVLMMRIKAAGSAQDVLATVQAHLPTMTHRHLLQALRSIFNLQRANKLNDDNNSIIKDPSFSVLCQNFKKHARALEANEAIEATKVLTYLGVSVDSLLVQTLLQIIRCQINLLNIRQIMFFDFLLSRFDCKNHLVDALKLALPLAFQIHLPLELDKQDLPLLKDMLYYCCSHELPDRCVNNVVTGLLVHDQVIDAHTAKSIVWSLCEINCTEEIYPTRVQLLHICYDILTQNLDRLSYDEVLRTAAKIKGRVLEKHPEYYHEQLVDAIAGYVVKNNLDFEKGLLVARILSRIAHTNLALAEYLCNLAHNNTDIITNARTNVLFGFINCLANFNYTPQPHIWTNLRRQISLNPVLNSRNATLPWTKVCLELASLGHYEDKLIERVFSKEYLDDVLAGENNTLDYLQLLTLQEAVKCFHSSEHKLPEEVLQKARQLYPTHRLTEQLEQYLARGLGGSEYVRRNVVLPNGFVADLVICMKGGYPVQLAAVESVSKVPISALNIPSGAIEVCIMNFNQGCFAMNSNRLRGTFRLVLDILERDGYAAVAINTNEWLSAPPHERTPYLIREIGYKCGEIGIKLTAG